MIPQGVQKLAVVRESSGARWARKSCFIRLLSCFASLDTAQSRTFFVELLLSLVFENSILCFIHTTSRLLPSGADHSWRRVTRKRTIAKETRDNRSALWALQKSYHALGETTIHCSPAPQLRKQSGLWEAVRVNTVAQSWVFPYTKETSTKLHWP